ncbi:MAG: DUF885 domain-containing protein, partial [Cyclobacteriaceae bacterium]|nr:DUF885 domain-containing protein [Cyclobacteriaceae bacterium]
MKKLFFISILFLSINSYSQTASTKLNEIFSDVDKFEHSINPQDSLYRGLHIKGKFSEVTETTALVKYERYQKFITRLNEVSDSELTRQEFISKQVMLLKLGNIISSVKYNMFMIPLNAEGGFYMWINRVLNRLPFKSVNDYDDYLHWLPSYVNWLEDHLKLMQKGISIGVVAPKVVINNNIKLLEPWVIDDFNKSPFYKPINQIPENWDQKEAEKLRAKAQEIISKQVIPLYKKIDTFLRTDYLIASPNEPGVKFLNNGKAYYVDRVNYYTTLPMTPDSVHILGLQEVDRIKKLMLAIIKETEFDGSFEDFIAFLRTDEQFYAKTPQELLNHAAWLSKKAEAQLPKLFEKLYSLPFTVAPVPDDIAPTYTGGRYVPGSWKQQRSGTYWVNTYKLESRTLYTIPSLTLHEAVPGHHLQGALAKELTGIPDFRNNYYISAFGEGWGLYSEFLGEEMGMYATPYERFGRYTYEMWRACRLVVDTG